MLMISKKQLMQQVTDELVSEVRAAMEDALPRLNGMPGLDSIFHQEATDLFQEIAEGAFRKKLSKLVGQSSVRFLCRPSPQE